MTKKLLWLVCLSVPLFCVEPLATLADALQKIEQIKPKPRYINCCPSSVWKNLAQNKNYYPEGSRPLKMRTYSSDCWHYSYLNKTIPKKQKNALRIASYNIHYWSEVDGKRSTPNVITALKNLNVDIICFQEINYPNQAVQGTSAQKFLHNLGYKNVIFKATNGTMGVMIAAQSEVVIQETAKGMLPRGGWDEGYVVATIKKNCKELILCCSHPTHGNEVDREAQVKYLHDTVLKPKQGQNVMIAADWNAIEAKDYQYYLGGKKVLDILNEHNRLVFGHDKGTLVDQYMRTQGYVDAFALSGVIPNFTHWTGMSIDRFMIYKPKNAGLKVLDTYIYFDSASDHLPIIVDVELQ